MKLDVEPDISHASVGVWLVVERSFSASFVLHSNRLGQASKATLPGLAPLS